MMETAVAAWREGPTETIIRLCSKKTLVRVRAAAGYLPQRATAGATSRERHRELCHASYHVLRSSFEVIITAGAPPQA